MGIASSSNVAQVVTNVTNSILASVDVSNNNVTSCMNSQAFNNCKIDNLKIRNFCDLNIRASSIVKQSSQDTLNSNVAQTLLQKAQSTVGSLGIGYASANNLASALVKSSNTITHSLTNSCSNVANIINLFNCNNSSIGNIDIDNETITNTIIEQVSSQVNNDSLVSSVTQDISQSATATVEGLTGFLLALAVVIVAVGYVIFKPFGMLLSNKIIIVVVMVTIVAAVILLMFIKQLPPFFNPPTKCAPGNDTCCGDGIDCVDQELDTVDLISPPLRYALDILGVDGSMPNTDPNGSPGLIQLAIAKANGWNENSYNTFKTIFESQGYPNLLVQTGISSYATNASAWTNDVFTDVNKTLYARFLLCNYLGIDTSIFIFEDEPCMINGKVVSPSSIQAGCKQFNPAVMPQKQYMYNAYEGNGTVKAMFGNCNNQTYKVQTFMKKGGFVIPIVVMTVIIGFTLFYNNSKPDSVNNK